MRLPVRRLDYINEGIWIRAREAVHRARCSTQTPENLVRAFGDSDELFDRARTRTIRIDLCDCHIYLLNADEVSARADSVSARYFNVETGPDPFRVRGFGRAYLGDECLPVRIRLQLCHVVAE